MLLVIILYSDEKQHAINKYLHDIIMS